MLSFFSWWRAAPEPWDMVEPTAKPLAGSREELVMSDCAIVTMSCAFACVERRGVAGAH